jgi:hypothetical protein
MSTVLVRRRILSATVLGVIGRVVVLVLWVAVAGTVVVVLVVSLVVVAVVVVVVVAEVTVRLEVVVVVVMVVEGSWQNQSRSYNVHPSAPRPSLFTPNFAPNANSSQKPKNVRDKSVSRY